MLMMEDLSRQPLDSSCKDSENALSSDNSNDTTDEEQAFGTDTKDPETLHDHFEVFQSRILEEIRNAIREELDDFRRAMASPGSPGSPAPGSPVPGSPIATFDNQFKAFAKFGDSKSTGDTITLSNSDKWFKQAKVIDGKKITTTDTGIYFKQIAKTKKALNNKEYQQFLDVISKNKKMDIEDIKQKLTACGPPSTTRTTPVATGGAVARLTDHTKYTGTHKQRFDGTGRGKGKEGREDVPPDSGYVQGYKDQGVYDKTH